MKTLGVTILAIAALAGPAAAAANCGPKEQLTEALAAQFGEMAFASGTSVDSSVQFYGNPDTGTWSVLVIKPSGMGCVVAIGDDLQVGIQSTNSAEGASY